MTTQTLVVELLTEEMPPRSLPLLERAFASAVADLLRAGQYLSTDSVVSSFATPRRLAVSITNVLGMSPNRAVREKIMPVSVALDADGQGTSALHKKLVALKLDDIELDTLERAMDGKAETFFHTRNVPGQSLELGLGKALPLVVARLPVAKIMRYQLHVGSTSETTVQFVRPARHLLVLWGETVLPVQVLGLVAGRQSQGHRFLSPGSIQIEAADNYQRTLHEVGRVVASFEDRRSAIREGLMRAAGESIVLMPETLLDEVSALVEWPSVYAGAFDAGFLEVPQECLILTMQQHQRYFALVDQHGIIQNRFLLVSNIQTSDPRAIISGNERVLRARLSDAKFFFEQDQKKSLESRLPLLDKMVYHRLLGSLGGRVVRIVRIAVWIARCLDIDTELVKRAALLAKADLVTDMVGEFPELQGTMGRYYALNDQEAPEVAQAIGEHYRPRFAKDGVPSTAIGCCVSLADKLESIVGMFRVGNVPTGDRDPYALRRQALGALRILIEGRLALDFGALLAEVDASFAEGLGVSDATEESFASGPIRDFFTERLRSLLKDAGYSTAEVESLVCLAPDRIDLLPEQIQAVRAFAQMPESASLAAANKRIGNILKKADLDDTALRADLLVEPAEQALAAVLQALEPKVRLQYEAGDFTAVLRSLSALREPVDAFFQDVMVMTDDPRLRHNRIALLNHLYRLMNQFADLSKLASPT